MFLPRWSSSRWYSGWGPPWRSVASSSPPSRDCLLENAFSSPPSRRQRRRDSDLGALALSPSFVRAVALSLVFGRHQIAHTTKNETPVGYDLMSFLVDMPTWLRWRGGPGPMHCSFRLWSPRRGSLAGRDFCACNRPTSHQDVTRVRSGLLPAGSQREVKGYVLYHDGRRRRR